MTRQARNPDIHRGKRSMFDFARVLFSGFYMVPWEELFSFSWFFDTGPLG